MLFFVSGNLLLADRPAKMVTSAKLGAVFYPLKQTQPAATLSRSRMARSSRRMTVCMASETPASRYAGALIELGQDSESLESIHGDMEKVRDLMKVDVLSQFLMSPIEKVENKKDVLSKVAAEREMSATTINFLNILVDRSRIALLPEICTTFEKLYCAKTETAVVKVISAIELEAGQKELIAKYVQKTTGKKLVRFKPVVDESLLGGFILQLGEDGSKEIDLSVKGSVDSIQKSLSMA